MDIIIHQHLQLQIKKLRKLQKENGSWQFCFEGSPLTDCLMIMTLCVLDKHRDIAVRLANRLERLQEENGAWKLYEDEEEGNLSATILAYTALRMIGRKHDDTNSKLFRAKAFIKNNGGLHKSHVITKSILALFGLYPYPKYVSIPMPIFLLPPSSPFSIFQLSNYARIHFTPMIICINKRFITDKLNFFLPDDYSQWFHETRFLHLETLLKEAKKLALYPAVFHKKGFKEAGRFMLERLESNGLLCSYAVSTLLMIYALLALGYEKQAPVIERAVEGLTTYLFETDKGLHLQNSPSTVWDTALLSYALQEAGVDESDPMIVSANEYILSKQHNKKGDWAVHVQVSPGGWGFSDINTIVPDNDDTSAALRALTAIATKEESYRKAWDRGIHWLLAQQNDDGGFGSFERGGKQKWLKLIPLDNAEDAMLDESTADITGRVLEFLGKKVKMTNRSSIEQAVNWLFEQQEENGSWYGKWGVCYIYGTWAAVTGLCAVGISPKHPALQKAARWLESIQHSDGGFGESCKSHAEKIFTPLSYSTPSQTAWAVDALLTVKGPNDSSVKRGIERLLSAFSPSSLSYPTGAALNGQFYIRYHSYNDLFPLLTLAHYVNKKKAS